MGSFAVVLQSLGWRCRVAARSVSESIGEQFSHKRSGARRAAVLEQTFTAQTASNRRFTDDENILNDAERLIS
jgi:hypothetical protein